MSSPKAALTTLKNRLEKFKNKVEGADVVTDDIAVLEELIVLVQKILDNKADSKYKIFKKKLLELGWTGCKHKKLLATKARCYKKWLELEQKRNGSVLDFSKLDALHYLNHVSISRALSNTSYNNYLTQIRSLFNELKKSAYIQRNHFLDIDTKREKQTTRRPFTKDESVKIASYLNANYPMLFLAIILEHYCLIRPAELRRLRLSAIDFSKSFICIDADVAKMNVARVATIPLSIWEYLKPYVEYPTNYFLFGQQNLIRQRCVEKKAYQTHIV